MWLIAALAAHEQHGDGTERRHRDGVVAGAGGEPHRRNAERLGGFLEDRGEPRVHDGRGRVHEGVDREGDPAPFGDGAQLALDLRDHGLAQGVLRRAGVDRERDLAGDHVDGARRDLRRADGRDGIGAPGADALDRGDHLGRRRERVAAHRHRHGAGMAGLALHERAGAGDAGDRRDDPDGEVLRFEQRALLDVNLEIADDVLAAAGERRDGVRVAAEG